MGGGTHMRLGKFCLCGGELGRDLLHLNGKLLTALFNHLHFSGACCFTV